MVLDDGLLGCDANEDADVTARMENFNREGHPRLDSSVFVRDAKLTRRNVLNLRLDFFNFETIHCTCIHQRVELQKVHARRMIFAKR